MVYGAIADLLPDHPALFIYQRILGDKAFQVMLNLSDDPQVIAGSPDQRDCLLCNYSEMIEHGQLRPWEARLYQL